MNTPKPSNVLSITLAAGYQKTGFPKDAIREILINNWNISIKLLNRTPKFLAPINRFYILHWSPQLLFNRIDCGQLNHNDVDYLVIYHNCTRLDCRESKELMMSFRSAIPEYQLQNYVLVRPIKTGKGNTLPNDTQF